MGSCLAMILVIVQRIGSMLYANYPHRLRFFDWVTPPQKCSSNRALGVVERACAEINPIPTKKRAMGPTQPINQGRSQEPVARTTTTGLQAASKPILHEGGFTYTCRPLSTPSTRFHSGTTFALHRSPSHISIGQATVIFPIWERVTSKPWVLKTQFPGSGFHSKVHLTRSIMYNLQCLAIHN